VNELISLTPQPPEWKSDWDEIDRSFDWVRQMSGCRQDAIHHAEGDVWIHTRMVCEAMTANDQWRSLPEDERAILFAAALLHDVAKPLCTRFEDGRVTSRGHSRRGEVMARNLLWRMNAPFNEREQIASLIRNHQAPFFLIERDDRERLAIRVSQTARCDHLALLARADAAGRICEDRQKLFDHIDLFIEYCREQRCLDAPRRFASDHSRFLYFRSSGRDPDYLAYDDTRSEVVMMSGLPGAGKDRWVAENLFDWPVISLDELRREMNVSPTDKQGRVIGRARELARERLRAGERFVWNATNISRHTRSRLIDLFTAYRARVRIVYIETSSDRLYEQNRKRSDAVPNAVIERLLDQWEVPDLTEAHRVDYIARRY
jgi:predicted kinase